MHGHQLARDPLHAPSKRTSRSCATGL